MTDGEWFNEFDELAWMSVDGVESHRGHCGRDLFEIIDDEGMPCFAIMRFSSYIVTARELSHVRAGLKKFYNVDVREWEPW